MAPSSFPVAAATFSVSVGAIAAAAAGGGATASAASLAAAVVGRDRADNGGGLGVIGRDLHGMLPPNFAPRLFACSSAQRQFLKCSHA